MANIKDVAKEAGVSPTTVSLILNGKAKERRISDDTCEKVYKAMALLDYHPNLSARRLRNDEVSSATIAFYWPGDYRSNILGVFLNSFAQIKNRLKLDIDLVIRSFKNDHLQEASEPILKNVYNGIIIGGTSKSDIEYLESLNTNTPIVLINRDSDKYSTVNSNNIEMGNTIASILLKRNISEIGIFTSQRPYMATSLRVQALMYACSKANINVLTDNIIKTKNTIEGGVEAVKSLLKNKNFPKIIFCDSDFIALGAMYEFYKNNIHIPEDYELIAVQFLPDEHSKYSIPPLSTIVMPHEELLLAAIEIIMNKIATPILEPEHKIFDMKLNLRDSFISE